MRFSVIIPTYGRPEFLSDALNSVLLQTDQDFEVIVVDDASPSPVALPVSDKRIRLVRRDTNGGPAGARNTGLEQAQGEYVSFLDDDDLYTPDRLSIARNALKSADVSICARGVLGTTEVCTPVAVSRMFETFNPSLGQVAVRRAVCRVFDERYWGCEDIDWLIRTVESSSVALSDEVGWLHRVHAGERARHGTDARIAGSRMLLREHVDFFKSRRGARAFRWYRIAQMSRQRGYWKSTVVASARSSAASPTWTNIRRNSWEAYRAIRLSLR